ncbi:MAG: putative DNA binding domain-containing protein [Oscillospiraceae bacterium]|nr:putative DNA binding domain-containing protein [Oscillospiraceae bacterium]
MSANFDVSITDILAAPEGEHFEFKEAKNRYDFEEAVKYCCALANCGGGKLVLGISDKRPRKVVGSKAFEQPERTCKGMMDKLRVHVDFQLFNHENDRVLVFEIASRPVGLPVQADGVAWWRIGDSLVPMPEDVRRAIYAESGHDFSGEICKDLTIDDLDRNAIEIFRNKWAEYSSNKRIATLSVEQLLRDADIVNDKGVTYAALILLGRREPLLEYLPTAEVVFEYRPTEASGPANQREDFRIGFFNYYDRIWELTNLRNDKQHYQKQFAMLPVPTFNEIAVREALLNAVSHRDYQIKGSIFVRQYSRKLVIESPGGFLPGITPENILNRHAARNGRIAAVFQLCGLVERSGQGMNLIYEMSVKEAKPLPSFTGSDALFVKLTLDGQVIHPRMLALLKEIGNDRLSVMTTDDYLLLSALFREEDLRAVDPARFKHLAELEIVKFSEHGVEPSNGGVILVIGGQSATIADRLPIENADRTQRVVDYMANHDNVTTAQLADYLGLSQRTVRNILKELLENGLVDRMGNYRHAKYILKNAKSK